MIAPSIMGPCPMVVSLKQGGVSVADGCGAATGAEWNGDAPRGPKHDAAGAARADSEVDTGIVARGASFSGAAGFTLIEVLVAMTVLAVAAAGFVRATTGHVDTVAALEMRSAGGWAADNALAEARAGLAPASSTVLGRTWRVAVASRASDDRDIAALVVTAESGSVRVALRGFRDTAAPVPATGTTAATGVVPSVSRAALAEGGRP